MNTHQKQQRKQFNPALLINELSSEITTFSFKSGQFVFFIETVNLATFSFEAVTFAVFSFETVELASFSLFQNHLQKLWYLTVDNVDFELPLPPLGQCWKLWSVWGTVRPNSLYHLQQGKEIEFYCSLSAKFVKWT